MKPEEIYRNKINILLYKYFNVQEEAYSISGKRIDYILQCKSSNAIFGLEVKSEKHKRGIDIGKFLKQAEGYVSELWKTKFLKEPGKIIIFIAPAISASFVQLANPKEIPIKHNNYDYMSMFHPMLCDHSNVNSWIGEAHGIGEIRKHSYRDKEFTLTFMNKIIWESCKGIGKLRKMHYDAYNEKLKKTA